jgi:hypothetical protein
MSIVREADACTRKDELGALLHRDRVRSPNAVAVLWRFSWPILA